MLVPIADLNEAAAVQKFAVNATSVVVSIVCEVCNTSVDVKRLEGDKVWLSRKGAWDPDTKRFTCLDCK